MYCGNCGSSVTPDQKFCRLCGTNLIATGTGPANPEGIPTGYSNKFLIAVEVVTDALTRGVRYFFQTGTTELVPGATRQNHARWGYLCLWAGIAASFLGRAGGIGAIAIGIILMVYARLGSVRNTASRPYDSPAAFRPQGTAPTVGWASSGDGRSEQAVRQAPFPGQFAETSTIRLPTEGKPPGDVK